MTEITVKPYRSKDHFLVVCPQCSNHICDGDWHSVLNDGSSMYVVGEIRRCTNPVCRERIRCRTVFSSEEEAGTRCETVEIDLCYSHTTKNWELFDLDFDVDRKPSTPATQVDMLR